MGSATANQHIFIMVYGEVKWCLFQIKAINCILSCCCFIIWGQGVGDSAYTRQKAQCFCILLGDAEMPGRDRSCEMLGTGCASV